MSAIEKKMVSHDNVVNLITSIILPYSVKSNIGSHRYSSLLSIT